MKATYEETAYFQKIMQRKKGEEKKHLSIFELIKKTPLKKPLPPSQIDTIAYDL